MIMDGLILEFERMGWSLDHDLCGYALYDETGTVVAFIDEDLFQSAQLPVVAILELAREISTRLLFATGRVT